MRELVVENQEVMIIPHNFKSVNRGIVKSVNPDEFFLELEMPPNGIVKNIICEFYTQTPHGKLFFESYPKEITKNTIVVASPAKHRFLQRRQFTRVKFVQNLELKKCDVSLPINTIDISAGGIKFKSFNSIDIDSCYNVEIPITSKKFAKCEIQPIRIEKRSETDDYLVSARFKYFSNRDRMILTQYCAKRSFEIKNK